MKIIHCVFDEKFMKGAMDLFNSDTRHNNTYVYIANKQRSFNAKYLTREGISVIDDNDYLDMLPNYDVVILHSWFSASERTISKIPKKCIVVWLAWGFDLYNPRNPMIPICLYGDKTNPFVSSQKHRPIWAEKIIDGIRARYRNKALKRVDFFSGVYPYEYDLLKKHKSCFRAKPLDFYYGSLNFFVSDDYSTTVNDCRKDVIIGNSADPSNNHVEALTYLSKLSLQSDTRIIIPLSYGGSRKYTEWVKDYAQKLYPGIIKPLDNYMPIEEYTQLVSNCRIAIYAHRRQQASDNILMQIIYGANVFLSEESLALDHYRSLGVKIFSIEHDLNSNFHDLCKEDIINNRKIIANYYGQSSLLRRITIMNDRIQESVNRYHV